MTVGSNELGELLIDLGLIDSMQLKDAMEIQKISGHRLTVVLSEMGLVTERQLKDALELQYGVNFVNLSKSPPEKEIVELIPETVEREFRFVPVSRNGAQFTVAMVDPDDLKANDAIKEHLDNANFKKLVCTADDFEHVMQLIYEQVGQEPLQEAALVEEPEVAEAVLQENHKSTSAARNKKKMSASHTKMKAHMRNLFESDDDLDSMFGTESGDSINAVEQESLNVHQEVYEEQEQLQPAAPSKKSIKKSITSLFGDDDDDFSDDDDAEPEPQTEQSVEEDALPAFPEILESQSLTEVEAEESLEEVTPETAMPSSQLLEHILQEAGVPQSKPNKVNKKKSMKSLFDDDDDMDFGNDDEIKQDETSHEDLPESPGDDIEQVVEDEPVAESQEPEISEASAGEIEAPSKRNISGKAFRSLFDDEMDEDDLFNDAQPGLTESLTGHEALSLEQPREAVTEEEEQQAHDESPEAQNWNDEQSEPEPQEQIEPAEDTESAESLMSAIEKPFHSLFDDDDDEEDLFAGADRLNESAPIEEVKEQEEAPEQRADEDEDEIETAFQHEDEDEAPVEPAKETDPSTEFEVIPKAYTSFDDEMDEDGLFASASHPIPEGAPHLRDLLSRFDDSDAAFDALEDSLKSQHQEVEELTEPASPDEGVIPVSALLAALDEQLPEDSIQSRTLREPAENEEASQTEFQAEEEEEEEEEAEYAPLESLHPSPQDFQQDEVPLEPELSKRTDAQPKSKKLRALLSNMDDEDDFDSIMDSPALPVEEKLPAPEPEPEPVADQLSVEPAVESEEVPAKAEFEEVLPLDQEDLTPPSSATSELPPVVVSRAVKTMTQGTGTQEEQPLKEQLETSVPEPEPAIAQSEVELDERLPVSATELPDTLEDVLSNVTSEIIEKAELSNLSGNRTEISFLEEIVESELVFGEEQPRRANPVEDKEETQEVVREPDLTQAQEVPQAAPVAQAPPVEEPPAPRPQPTPAQEPAIQAEPVQAAAATAPEPADLDPSILNLATQILTQAVNSPCSDVHFEPLADGLALRFMSEGELLDETILPAQIQGMLILCLKSMAGLDIAISDKPQDKKFVTHSFGDPVEMRITSIPGVHGEMVAVSLKAG